MINAGTVQVKLFADVKQFQAGMAGATASVGKMSKNVTKFAKASVFAFAAITAASAKMATDFDKRLREISTLIIGVTEKNIKNMSREIRDLANLTGKALDDLGKAKYDIISAGFTGIAESAQLLNSSARLAVGGVTSVTNAADLLTSALNSWQQSGLEAEKAADILFTTVRLGKTTMDELVGSVGRVFPTAKTLGASLADVGAAMATITAGGIKTYEAATYLNQAFTKLGAPSDSAAKAMKKYGVGVKVTDEGMFDLLATIKQFQGYDLQQMRKFFPEIRAIKAVLAMSNNMEFLERSIRDTANAAGASQVAFEKMSKSWSVQLSKNVMKLKDEFIELGNEVMPTIVEVFDDFMSSFDINPQKIVSTIEPIVRLLSDLLPIVVNLLPIIVKLSIAYFAINAAIKVGIVLNTAYQWSMAAMVGTTNILIGALELLNLAFWKIRANMLSIIAVTATMAVIATIVAGVKSATNAWDKYKKKRDEALNFKVELAIGDIVSMKDAPIDYKINVSAYFDKKAEKFLELVQEEKTRNQMAGHSNKININKMASSGDPMYAYLQQGFDKIALSEQQAETAKNFDFSARAYAGIFGNYADAVLGAYKDNFTLELSQYNPPSIFSLLGLRDEQEYEIEMKKLNKWRDNLDVNNTKITRAVLGTGSVGSDLKLGDMATELENVLSLAMDLNKLFTVDFAKSMGMSFEPLYDAIVKMKDAGIDYNMSAEKLLDMKNIQIDTEAFIVLRKLIGNTGTTLDEFFKTYEKGLNESGKSFDDMYDGFKNAQGLFRTTGMKFDLPDMVKIFDIPTGDLEDVVLLMYKYQKSLEQVAKIKLWNPEQLEKMKEAFAIAAGQGVDLNKWAEFFGLIPDEVEKMGGELTSLFKNIGNSIASTMASSFAEIILSGRVAMQELEKYNKGLTNSYRTSAEIQEDAWSNMWNNILTDTLRAVGEMLIKYALLTAGLLILDAISGGMLGIALGATDGVGKDGEVISKGWQFLADLFKDAGGEGFTNMFVKDAVITPSGQVVHTAPDDYIMAMKDPASFGKNAGGGGDTYNVTLQMMDATDVEGLINRHKQPFARGVGNLINNRNLVVKTGGQNARASY